MFAEAILWRKHQVSSDYKVFTNLRLDQRLVQIVVDFFLKESEFIKLWFSGCCCFCNIFFILRSFFNLLRFGLFRLVMPMLLSIDQRLGL